MIKWRVAVLQEAPDEAVTNVFIMTKRLRSNSSTISEGTGTCSSLS